MPADTEKTKPVLVHLDPDDWEAFKKLVGKRQASMAVRRMIRSELRQSRSRSFTRASQF
jgi:hypothetical protein